MLQFNQLLKVPILKNICSCLWTLRFANVFATAATLKRELNARIKWRPSYSGNWRSLQHTLCLANGKWSVYSFENEWIDDFKFLKFRSILQSLWDIFFLPTKDFCYQKCIVKRANDTKRKWGGKFFNLFKKNWIIHHFKNEVLTELNSSH